MLLELYQPNRKQSPVPSVSYLVRVALDLGAADFGGPLSIAELGMIKKVREMPKPDTEELALVQKSVLGGNDPLGEAFTKILPSKSRRPLGAVYTPASIVQPMVKWIMDKAPIRVIDPGAGSGRFSLQIALRNPLCEILAIDTDPVATLICRANLGLVGARSARVMQGDYLSLELPPADGITAFIGNPPYVRHHELSSETKERARKLAGSLNLTVSGLAGLHALFFLATGLLMKSGDIGCFVTSAEWLDVGYGQIIRDLLANYLGLQSLHLLDPTSVPFEETMTTAVISCFEAGAKTTEVALRYVHSAADLNDLKRKDRIIFLPHLAKMPRWGCQFRSVPSGNVAIEHEFKSMIPLGKLVRVSRGVATGANDFFVMTRREAEWRGLERRPSIGRRGFW